MIKLGVMLWRLQKQCENIFLLTDSVYDKEHFYVWMFPEFARMSFLQQVFLDEVTSGEKTYLSVP
jgi:hypothetical protein